MTEESFLITSTGGRIYRNKDDPPGTYRIPGGVKVTGYDLFTTESSMDLSSDREEEEE